MSLSAKEILAGVFAVQRNLLKPEEVADAIADGRSPGDRLGTKWDYLCDEAEDKLAAVRPAAPKADDAAAAAPAPKKPKEISRTPLVAGVLVLLIAVVGLGFALLLVNHARTVAARERAEAVAQLEAAKQAEAENLDVARKAIDVVYALAKDDPTLQQKQAAGVRRAMLEKILPLYQQFREGKPEDKAAQAGQAEDWLRHGAVAAEVGAKAEAEKNLLRARDSFAALAKGAPQEAEYQAGVARAAEALGEMHLRHDNLDRALDNFREARDGYRAIDVNHPGLADVSHRVGVIQRERRRERDASMSLVAAGGTYQQLIAHAPDDKKSPGYREALAATLVDLAAVQSTLRERKQALASAQKARALREALAKKYPDNTTYQNGLALACLALGDLHLRERRLPEAMAQYQQADAVQAALLKTWPDVVSFRHTAADVRQRLGDAQRLGGKAQDALASYESARTLYGKADTRGAKFGLARSERGLGLLAIERGQPADARKRFLTAEPLLRELVAAHPKVLAYQAELADDLADAATAARETDADAASKAFAQARELWRGLASDDGDEPRYRAGLAYAATQAGGLFAEHGGGDGEAAMREAFESVKILSKLDPDGPDHKRLLRDAHAKRGAVRARFSQYKEAAEDYDAGATGEPVAAKRLALRQSRLSALVRADEDNLAALENARILTINGVLALADNTKTKEQRDKAAEEWFAKAVSQLDKVEAKELPLLKLAKTDPEFAPLRGRDDFKEWLAELMKNQEK